MGAWEHEAWSMEHGGSGREEQDPDDDIAAHQMRPAAEFMLPWTERSMASSPHLPEAAMLPSAAVSFPSAACCVVGLGAQWLLAAVVAVRGGGEE